MAVVKSRYPDVEIPQDITLHELVLEKFDEYGNRKAIMDGITGRSYTFSEVKTLVRSFGSALVKRGFKKGDVLSVYLPNVPEYVIVFYGVISIGGIVTTVNPTNTERELLYQLRDSSAKYLVTLPQLADPAKSAAEKAGLKNVLVFGEVENCESAWDLLKDDGQSFPTHIRFNPKEDICILPYSSGTTGLPKGVMLTHYNLVACSTMMDAFRIADTKRQTADDVLVSLGLLPFYHVYGMLVSLGHNMRLGVMVIALPKFDPELFLKYIQDYKIPTCTIVPPILIFLAKNPIVGKYNLSSVQKISCGAAPLGKESMLALKRRLPKLEAITQGYGLTELTLACTSTPLDNVKPGSSGLLIPNLKCKIIDLKTGTILGKNQDGEILVKGPTVMKGYINKPEETAKTVDSEGWLHTGDIGYYDADGHLYIVGRIKELIKYNAYQVAPAELEALLLTNPQIVDAAVIGVPHPSAGELPKAFVVKRGEITEKEVEDFVAARVAPYKKLRGGVEFVDQIPKNPSGKILRRVMREKEARKEQNMKHKL